MVESRHRSLRPGLLVPVGERIWVVDELQPVAVVLDASTATVVMTVGWPTVPPPAQPTWRQDRQVRAAADGLWVQQPGGPLALVTERGLQSGHHTAGLTLGAVSAHGAWCLPDPPLQDIAASEDAPPHGGSGVHELLVAHPACTTAAVHVDSPVHGARSSDGDLYLRVETGRWSRRNLGVPTSWSLQPETAWLRLPAEEPLPARLSLATHVSDAPPAGRWAERDGGQRNTSPWLLLSGAENVHLDPWVTEPETAEGVGWYAGWDRGNLARGRDREAVVVARDRAAGVELFRRGLGLGTVRAMTAIGDSLWIAVEGPRQSATYSASAPTRLLRVHAGSGKVETVLRPDTVDVTDRCWPLPTEPVDTSDYTAFWRERFADLDHYWTAPNGIRGPLAAGLHDSRVEVVGSWPDTELHLTFGYAPRPGLRLRRTVPLFDQLGRQAAPEHAAIHLMEDLDTMAIPRAPAPGAEYLDI